MLFKFILIKLKSIEWVIYLLKNINQFKNNSYKMENEAKH